MIRSFRLLLMAQTLKVSPLLILSIRDLVWFCCAYSDSRRFQTAGCVQDSSELNVVRHHCHIPEVVQDYLVRFSMLFLNARFSIMYF